MTINAGSEKEKELVEKIHEIVERHFKGAALPGIGCGIILLLWVGAIVVAVFVRPEGQWGSVIGVAIIGALIGYPITKFLEKQRTETANQECDGELTELCERHGIDRTELFRVATEVMKIENIHFLAVIDFNLAERKFEADQERQQGS